MRVVEGVDALASGDGRLFLVVGVFDGLHLGHQYLLRELEAAASSRSAQPAVVTFDHHPDEVLTGTAPPLLIDPDERLERLAAAGVSTTVVQHFDEALRRTPYNAFVGRIRSRVDLAGFLMTPDAAFGFERRGTPEALTDLGRDEGFDVVVVPSFSIDGRSVRSAEIRAAIADARFCDAATLLGRPFTLTGTVADGRMTFALPMAVPPDGEYAVWLDDDPMRATIRDGAISLAGASDGPRRTVAFDRR